MQQTLILHFCSWHQINISMVIVEIFVIWRSAALPYFYKTCVFLAQTCEHGCFPRIFGSKPGIFLGTALFAHICWFCSDCDLAIKIARQTEIKVRLRVCDCALKSFREVQKCHVGFMWCGKKNQNLMPAWLWNGSSSFGFFRFFHGYFLMWFFQIASASIRPLAALWQETATTRISPSSFTS